MFTLKVKFHGLCLYVPHPDGKRVVVLMPDARNTGSPLSHPDGKPARPHVGAVSFSPANLNMAAPPPEVVPDDDSLVHRFGPSDIDFGIQDAASVDATGLELPEFGNFRPELTLRPRLLDDGRPHGILARMVLSGGTLAGRGQNQWEFSNCASPDGPVFAQRGYFTGVATWTRDVEAMGLTLNLQGFGGSTPVKIPLKPTPASGQQGGQEIPLKIENLCTDDPPAQKGDVGDTDRDVDFKWMYHLMQPKRGGTYRDILKGCDLPIPESSLQFLGFEHCIGAKFGFS